MSQGTRRAAIGGVVGLAVALIATLASAADLRTSARGQSVVRRASYQMPVQAATVPDLLLEETLLEPEAGGLGPSWDGCESCCPAPRCPAWCFWGSFEFMLWWQTGRETPPLVTTGSAQTSPGLVGSLGQADTEVLYGGDDLGYDARPGGRLTVGAWIDSCRIVGVGCRLYSLGKSEANYEISSDTVSILARPFSNLTRGREDADVVAYPGSTTGGITIQNRSEVGGGDVFFRRLFIQDACHRVDLLAGYQFARIDQDLVIGSTRTSVATGGSIPLGTVVENADLFETNNTYNAGQIGLMAEFDRGPVIWTVIAKVGLGRMSQQARISGSTTRTVPGQTPVVSDQGLLALDSNIGEYEQSVFSVSPEVALQLTYRVTERLGLTAGYSFIHWSHVCQPGDQIDVVLNTTQITGTLVGESRPTFPNLDSNFALHGLNFGVSWTW